MKPHKTINPATVYNWVFSSAFPLCDPYAKIVYLYLYVAYNSDQEKTPSYNDVAVDCGMSRPTAVRAIKDLTRVGVIAKENRFMASNVKANLTNQYIFRPIPIRKYNLTKKHSVFVRAAENKVAGGCINEQC